jgi:hypothetical protein
MQQSKDELTGMVSSITSDHVRRIRIGFAEPITDAQLHSAIESGTWGSFDDAMGRLAERILSGGRKLELELNVCGNPTAELFDQVLVRVVESGRLKIVKASYIWAGSALHRLSFSK